MSYACGICALLLLWAVYPKDYDFGQAAGDSILFLDAQRVGTLPDDRIPWRQDALLYEGSEKLGFPDLTGGWLNGGLIGAHSTQLPLPQRHRCVFSMHKTSRPMVTEEGSDRGDQRDFQDSDKWHKAVSMQNRKTWAIATVTSRGRDFDK